MSPVSRCPHCGARGVHMVDEIEHDGLIIRSDYCGKCGKNVPRRIPDQGRMTNGPSSQAGME
jgi:hypothetical protein